MKIMSKCTSIIVLAVTLIHVNAWTMNSGFSENGHAIKRRKVEARSVVESKSNEPHHHVPAILYAHEKLNPLLYETLDPMPNDLIKIILGYYSYEPVGKIIRTIKNDKASIDFLAALSDSALAIGKDTTVHIVNPETGEVLKTIKTDTLRSLLALSSEKLVIGTDAGNAEIWDIKTNNPAPLKKFQVDPNPYLLRLSALLSLSCLARLSETEFAVGPTTKPEIKIYDENKGCTRTFPNTYCLSLAAIPDTELIAVGVMLCIRFYNWRTGKQTNTITTTKFTQDYSNLIPLSKNILIAVEKQSDQIVLLDREKKGGKTLKFPTESIKNTPLISLLSCGFLAVAAEDNIYIFNVRTGKVVKHFKAPSPITCITSFENGRFATGAKDFDVHIWG